MLCDSVAGRLRRQQLYCGGAALTIRDPQFHQFSHQVRLDAPTHLQRDIYRAALTLAQQSWHAPSPIRALTVTALYLSDSADSFQQLDLLDSAATAKRQAGTVGAGYGYDPPQIRERRHHVWKHRKTHR